jgi:hypothetical protein
MFCKLGRRIQRRPDSRLLRGERTFISEVFREESPGLKPAGEEWLEVYYGPIRIG